MSFTESYKQLEKLCGEIMNDDRRVSAYIDEMIKYSSRFISCQRLGQRLKTVKALPVDS